MATHNLKWISADGRSRRTEDFDDQYGLCIAPWNKPIRSPYRFALKDGKMGLEALNELNKPIWGEAHDKPFGEVLPSFTKSPKEKLTVSNYKKLSEEQPTDPNAYYNTRKKQGLAYVNFQVVKYDPFWWGFAGVEEWKLVTEPATKVIDNPEYAPFQEAKTKLKQLLAETFEPYGTFIFPSFPLKEGYKWFLDDVEILQDPDHELASPDGGWILPLKKLPASMWDKKYEVMVPMVILLPNPINVQKILGLI